MPIVVFARVGVCEPQILAEPPIVPEPIVPDPIVPDPILPPLIELFPQIELFLEPQTPSLNGLKLFTGWPQSSPLADWGI